MVIIVHAYAILDEYQVKLKLASDVNCKGTGIFYSVTLFTSCIKVKLLRKSKGLAKITTSMSELDIKSGYVKSK